MCVCGGGGGGGVHKAPRGLGWMRTPEDKDEPGRP